MLPILHSRGLAGDLDTWALEQLCGCYAEIIELRAALADYGERKGNRFFTKRKATGRIDGTLALVMVIGAALTVPPPKQSVYEKRGVLTV